MGPSLGHPSPASACGRGPLEGVAAAWCSGLILLPVWPWPLGKTAFLTVGFGGLPAQPPAPSPGHSRLLAQALFLLLPRGPGHPCSPKSPKPRDAPAHAAVSTPHPTLTPPGTAASKANKSWGVLFPGPSPSRLPFSVVTSDWVMSQAHYVRSSIHSSKQACVVILTSKVGSVEAQRG